MLTKTGGGGLPELTDALDDSKASYAYVRVKFAKDKESTRERFVFVKWIGKGCKIMRKAKVSSPLLFVLYTPHILSHHSPRNELINVGIVFRFLCRLAT